MTQALTVYAPAVHVDRETPVVVLDPDLVAKVDALVDRDMALARTEAPNDLPAADAVSGEAHKLAKAIEANRKEAKAPFAAIGKEIDRVAKAQISRLETIKRRRDDEIAAVQREERRKAAEAEAERQRIEREAAAERARLAEMEAAAESEDDKAAAADLRRESKSKSAEAWVASLDKIPEPTPKTRVHTRKAKVAELVDASVSPTTVNGILLVKTWDKVAIRKLLEAGVDVPGWTLVERESAVRR